MKELCHTDPSRPAKTWFRNMQTGSYILQVIYLPQTIYVDADVRTCPICSICGKIRHLCIKSSRGGARKNCHRFRSRTEAAAAAAVAASAAPVAASAAPVAASAGGGGGGGGGAVSGDGTFFVLVLVLVEA